MILDDRRSSSLIMGVGSARCSGKVLEHYVETRKAHRETKSSVGVDIRENSEIWTQLLFFPGIEGNC
jgi:hypothetical protein